MTVDSPELNVSTPAESISPRQMNEIIIAVPTVSSLTERKSIPSKKTAIISFDEDENSSIINNNVLKSMTTTPPTNVSLADACLKYQEKQKLAEEKSKPFVTDSTYERYHAEPINVSATVVRPSETVYIEPESPTAITIINPVIQAYQSLPNSFDFKETDSSLSKATDSSSITSSTTTHSSTSPRNRVPSEPSHSTSMSSSISSDHNSPNVASSPENEHDVGNDIERRHVERDIDHDIQNENGPHTENDFIARIEELTIVENQHISRIQELEAQCVHLEQRVSALTM